MRRRNLAVAVGAVAATVLASAAGSPDPVRASAASVYVSGSDVAVVGRPLALHAAPDSDRVLARVGVQTEFGSPTRLAVVGNSGEWLAVISSELGNRVRGWVHGSQVRVVHTPYSVEVDLSARRLTVWRLGVRLRRFAVGIGAPRSPTPIGRFAVTDKLSNFWPSLYGCCAIALSGHQTQLPSGWDAGDRLAIHEGGGIGGAVSAGCLRAAWADMRYLMSRLPLGTQVVVHT
jgi:lipoprotein-anchoring transpeptidase ErfK/SrfK